MKALAYLLSGVFYQLLSLSTRSKQGFSNDIT
nr:MAG TPA: hypothetical protein [Caudoviricetes sp.]